MHSILLIKNSLILIAASLFFVVYLIMKLNCIQLKVLLQKHTPYYATDIIDLKDYPVAQCLF